MLRVTISIWRMLLKSIQFVIIDMVSVVVCVRQKGDIETSEKKKLSGQEFKEEKERTRTSHHWLDYTR